MRAALPEALEAGGAVESLCHGLAATGALLELLRGQRRRVFHAVGGTPCGDETTRRNGAVSGVTALEDNGEAGADCETRRERWGEAGVKMKNFLISVRCPPIKIMWPLLQFL